MDKPIRVLLADDHPLVRAGIRATLVAEGDFALVGEAASGDEAQRMCSEFKPDILLLDIHMPGSPAVQTVTALRQQCPGIKILILTAYDNDAYVRGLISAGAVGYVLKDEAPQTVVRAIRTVLQGDTWFSRAIIDKMARLGIGAQPVAASPVLTERETQVLRLVVKGKTSVAIANELSISEPTVRFHLRSIYDKIGVHSRTEAAVWAVDHGWGSGNQDEPIASDRSELASPTLRRGGRMPYARDATGITGEYLGLAEVRNNEAKTRSVDGRSGRFACQRTACSGRGAAIRSNWFLVNDSGVSGGFYAQRPSLGTPLRSMVRRRQRL